MSALWSSIWGKNPQVIKYEKKLVDQLELKKACLPNDPIFAKEIKDAFVRASKDLNVKDYEVNTNWLGKLKQLPLEINVYLVEAHKKAQKNLLPEVMQYKERLKNLGIKKVYLPNKPEKAKAIVETIEELSAQGVPINKLRSVVCSKKADELIFLTEGEQYAGVYLDKIKTIAIKKNLSMPTSDAVRHEVGHFWHSIYNPAKYNGSNLQESVFLNDSKLKKNLTKNVSQYAATSSQEMVAEMFCEVSKGKKYPPDLIHHYLELGGPVPENMAEKLKPYGKQINL